MMLFTIDAHGERWGERVVYVENRPAFGGKILWDHRGVGGRREKGRESELHIDSRRTRPSI